MKLDATYQVRTSKEGKEYEVVVLKISDKSEKLIFLNPAEKELLKIYMTNKNNAR